MGSTSLENRFRCELCCLCVPGSVFVFVFVSICCILGCVLDNQFFGVFIALLGNTIPATILVREKQL